MGSVFAKSSKQLDLKPNEIGRAQALDTAMAVIEFSPDGLIRYANDNFLNATGYRLDEIVGKHHRMFCEPEYAASQEYFLFWKHLAAGRTNAGTFKRNRKDGSAIYIEASYIPVKSLDGAVVEVIKIAQDVTEKTLRTMGVKAKSDQAHELSQQASAQAAENFGLIQSLTGHVQSGIKDVEDLGALAKRIGGITQVISDIAMQTNLLSLNAAIEAAHAGASGRGFAVVAAEVRLLATKSASQALEIEEMIVETQHGVHAVADKMKKCSVQSEQAMVQTQGAINSLSQLGVIAHELNGMVQSLK